MNLPVSPIRKECEKVIALNVDPLVADEYSKNVVSIALRAYHFIFQANTLPQKGIADLLIESYGLEEYSNRELELSLIHISEPTRQAEISYAVFCLKKKKQKTRMPSSA